MCLGCGFPMVIILISAPLLLRGPCFVLHPRESVCWRSGSHIPLLFLLTVCWDAGGSSGRRNAPWRSEVASVLDRHCVPESRGCGLHQYFCPSSNCSVAPSTYSNLAPEDRVFSCSLPHQWASPSVLSPQFLLRFPLQVDSFIPLGR